MALTGVWKFSGVLPGNGRWSSGTQTCIFVHKTCYFFPALGFAAMPGKCPGCVSPMKAQMWDLVAEHSHQRCVQGRKLLALVTVPFLHWATCVGPRPVPCSPPAKTQLKLITYQKYQHPHKACAGWRRRLSLSPFFPFRPARLVLWQSPRTWKGEQRGAWEGSNFPSLPMASFWSAVLPAHFHFTDAAELCHGETNPRRGRERGGEGRDESRKELHLLSCFSFSEKKHLSVISYVMWDVAPCQFLRMQTRRWHHTLNIEQLLL